MKLKASLLAAALLLTFAPLTAHADSSADDTTEAATEAEQEKLHTADGMFSYTIQDDGTVSIYKFLPTDHQGEVVIPSEIDGMAVTYIESACFLNTYSLTAITIPASVTDMGESVFFGCNSLEKITVEEGNLYFSVVDDGVLLGDDEKFLICYPAARAGENYTIPDTVDEIAPSSFAYSTNLQTVTIPESVGYVDAWAFAYSSLERIALPDSMVQLDDYAFAYCEKLADVDLGNGLQKIQGATFAGCTALAEIELPESLTTVGQYAFAGTAMKSVTIPSSVTEISFGAFGYNIDLNAIGNFVIYGEANSYAQSYCTANDSDNDYQNNFTFVDIANPEATVPAQTDAADSSADSVVSDASGTNDSADDSTAEETPVTEAPTVNGSSTLKIVLAVCGGVIAILAAVLVVLLVKKPKNKEQGDEE